GAHAGPARRGDGGARLERDGRVPVRGDAHRGPRAQGARASHRRGAALPRPVARRERGEPAPRAARARPAARPVGAPRRERADPRPGVARPRVGGTAHAVGAATGLRGRARGPVGPVAALRRGARPESRVTPLALDEVTFWY